MFYVLLVLQVLDLLTTHYALTRGAGVEGNPVLRKLFDKWGHERVLLLIKGAFIALLWWATPLVPVEVLYALTAFYVWVVINNVKIIVRHND